MSIKIPMPRLYFNGQLYVNSASTQYLKNIDLTQRCLSMLKKGEDRIIMYEHEDSVKLVKWYIMKEFINDDQVKMIQYISPMDGNYSESLIMEIVDFLREHPHKWEFVLNDTTETVYRFLILWTHKYGGRVMKDMIYPNKNAMYLTVHGEAPPLYVENYKLPRLRGFWCRNKEELFDAYLKLQTLGVSEMAIKPIYTSGGLGIQFIKDIDEIEYYGFPYGEIVLEEKVCDLENIFPVYHFEENKCCLDISFQLIKENKFSGVTNMLILPEHLQQECERQKDEFLKTFELKAFWGIDMMIVKNNIFVNDINSGRLNGSHPPKYFIKNHYSHDAKFIMENIDGNWSFEEIMSYDPKKIIEKLEPDIIKNININDYKCDMIPLTYNHALGEKSSCRMLWVFYK
jgi:hypothetical protein